MSEARAPKVPGSVFCPNCGKVFVTPRGWRGKMGGMKAGIAAGFTLGGSVGLVAGPLGGISGAIPGAIIGAGIGLWGGTQFDKRKCPQCGVRFTPPSA